MLIFIHVNIFNQVMQTVDQNFFHKRCTEQSRQSAHTEIPSTLRQKGWG